MEEPLLVFENSHGDVVRTFQLANDNAHVIYRHDVRRVEIHDTLEKATRSGLKFDRVADINSSMLVSGRVDLGRFGQIRLLDFIEETVQETKLKKDHSKHFSIGLVAVSLILMLIAIFASNSKSQNGTKSDKDIKINEVATLVKTVRPDVPDVVSPLKTKPNRATKDSR